MMMMTMSLVFYVPFNIIQAISRQWKGDNERLCTIKLHIGHELNSGSGGIQTLDILN